MTSETFSLLVIRLNDANNKLTLLAVVVVVVKVVSAVAFYSENPSLNPAEVSSFYSANYLKGTKLNEKCRLWPVKMGWLNR